MSGNIIEKNNSFDDYYNTDNFNDSELQARLYAEIYYESNIEGASETTDSSRTIKFDSMTTETNVESKRIQYESGEQYLEQPLTSKTTGGKSSKIKNKSKVSIKYHDLNAPKESFITKISIYNNISIQYPADSQKMPSTHQSEFVQVETMSSREINSAHGNKSSEDPSVVQEKEKKENSSKKHKFSKHVKTAHKESSDKNDNDMEYSKYNVVSKCVKQKVRLLLAEQMDKEDSSDSEKSIFEVPIPLKPEPPLIDLQDSDEENESNSEIDNDLIFNHNGASLKTYLKARPLKNCELEILQSNPQDTSSKSKTTSRSYNKDTVNSGKSIQTSTGTQDIMEDIVLNCTTIQRGAKSISEIKQLSKSIEVKQRSKSTENTSQNSKKTLPFLKGNNKNTNLQQEISVTPGKKLQIMQRNIDKSNNMYFTHLEQNRSSVIEPCNPVIDRKRRCNEIDDQSKQKRRCTSQQNNQNIMSQSSSTGEKRNMSNEFFEPMSEEMKNYYNLNRGQENFDIRKLQQSMSKDPRMWAILDEDLMPCPSSKRFRFWNVKCTNCQQDGHRRYDCPTPLRPPSCYMCGTKGHAEVRCPQKMCLTCGKPQNTFRNTCEYCRLLYCTMCDSVGHEQNQCPDLWRRYHQTTDMSSMPQDPGNVMKPSKLLYCCNCTKRGHESSTCREYRWSENFPTPAAVTNYTDGPIYRSSSPHVSSYPGPDSELDLSLSETTENEISIPQYTIDTQQTITTEDVESSANVDTSSNINFYISPISQEVISQTKGNLKSPFIWPTVKTNFKPIKVDYIKFSTLIYSCGIFPKNNKDARMVLITLNTFFSHTKKNLAIVKNLIEHRTVPNFLTVLLAKANIEFEVNIGYIHRKILSLQLIAMKDYIEPLYDLLKYWLNLPEDEKDYGIDVDLPVSCMKMLNVLLSREPQLNKMRFRHYFDYIGGLDHPRLILTSVNSEKIKVENHCKLYGNQRTQKKYNRLRRNLFRLQTKLLVITNTEPEPNVYVRTFQDIMRRFKSGFYQTNAKLDTVTYLRLNLLYNQLFVPHTSENLHRLLQRIELEEKKFKDSQQPKLEICHVPEKEQQESEIHHILANQENLICTSTADTSSTTLCTSPNINSDNFFVIDNQQNNEILNDEPNVNNTLLETNKLINRNYDDITITIKTPLVQVSEIIPLNTAPMPSVKSKELKPNEDFIQLSTSEEIDSNVSKNKQNINVNNTPHLSKKEKKKLNYLKLIEMRDQNIYDIALNIIKTARALKVPHMMKAADEIQRQVNKRTVKAKHLRSLSKLIRTEQNHQKAVTNFCNFLKKK